MIALTPIGLDEHTNQYHVGYWRAQNDFRAILQHHLNKPLPDEPTGEVPAGGWDRTIKATMAK